MPMNGWFWTTDPLSEALTQQMGGAENWQETTICCKLLKNPEPDSIPLTRYRFTSGTDEISHYWTTDWNSEAMSNDLRWTQEDVIGHVFQTQKPNTVPLLRFRGQGGLRYWTTDPQDTQGLTLDLQVGWVYPATSEEANLEHLRRFDRLNPAHCIQYHVGQTAGFMTVHIPRNLTNQQVSLLFIPWIANRDNRPQTDYTIDSVTEGPC